MIAQELEAKDRLQEDIELASKMIEKVKEELAKKIVGQNDLIESLLISLF
jgi:hypothetical protein